MVTRGFDSQTVTGGFDPTLSPLIRLPQPYQCPIARLSFHAERDTFPEGSVIMRGHGYSKRAQKRTRPAEPGYVIAREEDLPPGRCVLRMSGWTREEVLEAFTRSIYTPVLLRVDF